MYAVIFRAKVAELNDEYFRMAERMKDLAFKKYGCLDFVSVTEGDKEIAISYWETEQHIRNWKNDPEHRLAQAMGRDKWYKSFSVEICKVIRKWRKPSSSSTLPARLFGLATILYVMSVATSKSVLGWFAYI